MVFEFGERYSGKEDGAIVVDDFGHVGFAECFVVERDQHDVFLEAFLDAVIIFSFECLDVVFVFGCEEFESGQTLNGLEVLNDRGDSVVH